MEEGSAAIVEGTKDIYKISIEHREEQQGLQGFYFIGGGYSYAREGGDPHGSHLL